MSNGMQVPLLDEALIACGTLTIHYHRVSVLHWDIPESSLQTNRYSGFQKKASNYYD